MDLTPLLPAIVFVHVASAFVFAAGHGVSMVVAFRLRHETDTAGIRALLDLSGWSLNFAGMGLLVLLVTGILAGIAGGHFGRGWIWASLALLLMIGGSMTPLGAGYFNRVRRGLGIRAGLKADEPDPVPLLAAEIAALAATSRQPGLLAAIGGGGFLVILWLMTAKPF